MKASKLQRPLPDGVLKIVASGEPMDGCAGATGQPFLLVDAGSGLTNRAGRVRLDHASLLRPIDHSRNVVRMLAATLVPEHCSSGHCGKLCRWSHLISSAKGQRNCLAQCICRLSRAGQTRKMWSRPKDS